MRPGDVEDRPFGWSYRDGISHDRLDRSPGSMNDHPMRFRTLAVGNRDFDRGFANSIEPEQDDGGPVRRKCLGTGGEGGGT
jgi:hypothetical protein